MLGGRLMETLKEYMIHDAKAIVLVIHGSGEHIGRYQHVAEWLNKQSISMVGGDLPGLGRAKGKRGHVEDFEDYLLKVDEWIEHIKNNWPDLPIFLFGHSMGGLITLRYLEELKDKNLLKGVIVTSPAIKIGVTILRWQLITAKALEKIWPTFKLKSGIKSHQVSRDPGIVKQYEKDPLVYGKVSIRWFFEFQKAIEEAWEKTNKISELGIPLLFMQAGADQLVDPNAAIDFTERLDKNQVTFQLIPDLYHEILNEPEKEIYLKMISNWILEKI